MPVRSQGKLLAGVGALLGICAAGMGCQSSSMRQNTYAVQARPASSSSPFLSLFRRDRPARDQVIAQAGDDSSYTVVASSGSPARQGEVTSAWQNVQRVSTDEDNTGASPSVAPVSGTAAIAALRAPEPLKVETRSAVDLQGPPRPVTVASIPSGGSVLPLGPEGAVETTPQPRLIPEAAPPVAHVHPHPPVPKEFSKQSLPPYVVEPPDILLIEAGQGASLPTQPIRGQHLVRMDGYIDLGIYGSVYVAGMTLEQVKDAVANQLLARINAKESGQKKDKDKELTLEMVRRELQVDVLAFNSKVYYIITDGGGYGEQVYRIPVTGNETVLDALSQINGLPAVASKKNIWVARASPHAGPHPTVLPVNWKAITQCGSGETNYQIFPGDRIYVKADKLITTDSILAKILNPIDRVFGSILLGSSTVNSIRNSNNNGVGNGVIR